MPEALGDFFCSWSGGKDSCLSLARAISAGGRPRALVTMMIENGQRSRSHGLHASVLEAQAAALQIPLIRVSTSWADYEENFVSAISTLGIRTGVFGDIDLLHHRAWVEKSCERANVAAFLPLWQQPRRDLVADFLTRGFRAELVAVKDGTLKPELLGRVLSGDFLEDFSAAGIDLAGEEGEYHTVVTDGPLFREPLSLAHRDRVLRDGYWFSDAVLV